MQPVAIEAHMTNEFMPGDSTMLRCDEEGVPNLVQRTEWNADAGCFLIRLIDESTIGIPGKGCGARYFQHSDMILLRIEEIVGRNWADLMKTRKEAETNIGQGVDYIKGLLSQVGDKPNPDLH